MKPSISVSLSNNFCPILKRWSGSEPITPDSYHHLRLFLTPGITSFGASVRNITQLSLLPMLALKCTGLTHLSIGHGAANLPDLAAKSVMSKFVCELHRLEWLVAGDLDQAAFSHLARLPRLRHLWLMSFGRLAPPMAFQSLAGSRPFPALKSLLIETIEYAPAFFQFLSKCSLEKFTILLRGYSVPYTNETAKNCWSTLATHCSHASLQKIIFQWSSILELPTVNVDTYSIKGDILRPLFPFRSLVKLDLEHSVGFDLDDAAVLDMARAWPCVQLLSLSSHSRHIQPRVTLVGISGIAQHCPRLQRFGITFDATVIPELKPEVPSHTALYELDVAYSPIGDPFEVANYLGVIFPGLGSIRTLYVGLRDPENMADVQVVTQHNVWKKFQWVLT
ncbi:hypothetical protein DFH08DRAFT_505091 [Mycena albidolilacea]|uniref:Uncharacterized protein n=1 Tax=Mycena albidolilacea TaxID=1033008 RepID=A0AAD7ADC4_9AGAR|nr:hypothetical protein DFH08DRAFT_505091 [Mycena albidolilacea]